MRRRFEDMNCSVARSLDIVGDWWTLLVVREAFLGARRFGDFESALGISKNILTDRLERLVTGGVLARVDIGEHGTHYEYVLTPMGKDLTAVITALRQWGDRWLVGAGNESLVVYDRRTNKPIPRLRVRGEDGKLLGASEMEVRAGPGATAPTRTRLTRLRTRGACAG